MMKTMIYTLHQQACRYFAWKMDGKDLISLSDSRRDAHTRPQHDGPNMSGNSDENESDSDDSDSSSLHEGTRMADSSFRGSMPSFTSRGKSHSQTTGPSPFSRPTFRPYSTPPYTSRPNPSVPPNMKGPAQANRFAQSTASQQYDIHEDNNPNRPPPVSPSHLPPRSSGGPQFRNNPGNFSKRDTNVYETNISSFNTTNNTIQNSFNDNSLVDSSGNRSCYFLITVMRT